MIEYFIRPMAGISSLVGRSTTEEFSRHSPMGFRRKPAGVVVGIVLMAKDRSRQAALVAFLPSAVMGLIFLVLLLCGSRLPGAARPPLPGPSVL